VKTAIGVLAWVLCLLSLMLVPVDFAWEYATIWVGITVVMTGYFVFGYAGFSDWRGSQEGAHILVFSTLVLLVSIYSFFYRLTVGQPAITPDVRTALYISAGVWISLAFLMLWRSLLWTARQVKARKRRREAKQ
jgi:hypothetical protein